MLVGSKGTKFSGKATVFTIHLQEEGSRLVKKKNWNLSTPLNGPCSKTQQFSQPLIVRSHSHTKLLHICQYNVK